LTLVLLGGLGASAQTATNSAVMLPPLVVTATREPRDPHLLPAAIHTRAPAERPEVASTPEMLAGLPSCMVQKTSHGQGSPFLRGFTGFRTLMLLDGVRLNNSVMRDGPNQYWNTVDPYAMRNYELVMGPASVLYGSDAVGGTLNALSADPPAWSGEPLWRGRALYRGSSAEDSHIGRLQFGARPLPALGFGGGITFKDFGDLTGGDEVGRQRHTGYDELAFDAKLLWTIDDGSDLTLAHQRVDQDDVWRTHRTPYGLAWHGLKQGSDLRLSTDEDRDLTYARYRRAGNGGWLDGLTLTISRQGLEEEQYRIRNDATSDLQGFEVETWGADLQLRSQAGPLGDFVYGVEYYRDTVDSHSIKYDEAGQLDRIELQGPVADDATYDTAALYAQDTITLTEGGLQLVPGLRLSRMEADAQKIKDPVSGQRTSLTESWTAAAGSLRLLAPLDAARSHVLYGGVSQGFRAPNLSDLTRFDIARSDEIETPAPDLDPERYLAFEAGFKSRLERLTLQASYYYTSIRDLIVRAPTGRLLEGMNEVTKRNAGDGYIQGLESSARLALGAGWSTSLAASWMTGRVDSYPTADAVAVRDYVSRLMPPSAEIALRKDSAGGRWWTELVAEMADKADRLSAEDRRDTQRIPPGGTPGYVVCHLRTGVRVGDGLNLGVTFENLFDRDYRIHGSGVNEAGRGVTIVASCDL
jgi:hemoglobin/transferrin/lactoferrin receptor protein